jgi:iron complex transport system permease protein
MSPFGLRQLLTTLLTSALLYLPFAALALFVGSTGIHWPTPDQLPFRRDAVLLASLVGASLGLAGVAYQAVLRNPLADPYLLGISSGATLASYLWQFRLGSLVGVTLLQSAALSLGQQGFSFAGALISVAIVFSLSSRAGRLDPITLLLVGVIVNAINGSLFLLLNALTRDLPAAGSAFSFLVGGLQPNLTSAQLLTTSAILLLTFLILMYLTPHLNTATTSDAEALSLGTRIHLLRWITLLTASLLTAAAVSCSGPIGFVGLVSPHLARLLVGNDHRKLLPLSTSLGASLLVLADASSRLLAHDSLAQTLLPVGVLTGLLGGPFFLLLLHQSRHQLSSPESLS